MVWFAVAIGVGTAAAGIYGAYKAGEAAEDASDAQAAQSAAMLADAKEARAEAQANQERALALSDQQLDFAQRQYSEWEATYGSIQANLNDFYSSLTPESLAAKSIKNLNVQYTATQKQIQRSFAQRGIDTASQDFMNQESSLGLAESKAEIRTGADAQVAALQSDYLASARENPYGDNISNAIGNKANAISGFASNQLVTSSNQTIAANANQSALNQMNLQTARANEQQAYDTIGTGVQMAVSNVPASQTVLPNSVPTPPIQTGEVLAPVTNLNS